MISNKIETNSIELEKILLCAFRYCINRETSAAFIFISYITQPNVWDYVSRNFKSQICTEINQYKQMHNKKECYMAEWNELENKILKELA